jgi:hypothetical protein
MDSANNKLAQAQGGLLAQTFSLASGRRARHASFWRGHPSAQWHRFCSLKLPMHATFTQKVIICMVAGFLAACLIQWAKVFVDGADDALNKGYKHTSPAISLRAKP